MPLKPALCVELRRMETLNILIGTAMQRPQTCLRHTVFENVMLGDPPYIPGVILDSAIVAVKSDGYHEVI